MAQPPDLTPAHVGTAEERRRLRALILRFGDEAVAFQGTESGMRAWLDAPAPDGSGGGVAFADTGSAWVAAGAPLGEDRALVARRFVEAARAAGRRALFFGVESPEWGAASFSAVRIGEQPEFSPAEWARSLTEHRSLREQLRRARAKQIRVRALEPEELEVGTPLRASLEAMAAAWLGSRPLEPMGFLVALEPLWHPEAHRYLVAEAPSGPVGFLSAIPIPKTGGWLVEDLLRSSDAPNGTTELLLDGLMRALPQAARVTLGLAPLAGRMAPWARVARAVGRPLYDFEGLRAFKARLRPTHWREVWLVHPRNEPALRAIWDALCAFAGGRPLRFLARSLLRHPGGPSWLLALPLWPWTVLLGAVALGGRARWLGWSPPAMGAWVLFDAALALGLFLHALEPRRRLLGLLASAATLDAALSLQHLAHEGFGRAPVAWVLRGLATAAPVLGAAVLVWALLRAPQGRSVQANAPGSSPGSA